MDAANPLCRWLLAAGLAASVGCASGGVSVPVAGRGQVPSDPIAPAPLAPVAPVTPSAPTGPFVPGAAIPGQPVVPAGPLAPTNPGVRPVGAANVPNAPNAAELLRESVPQIKPVAYVGATGLVTDQEVIEAVRQRPELAGIGGHELRAKEKELYAVMLRKIIERELILDDMYAKLKKNNKTLVIDDIKDFATKGADANLRGIRKDLGLDTEEKFQMWLRAQGLSEPVIRRQMERQMMAEEYVRSALKEKGRAPGFAELRVYYDRHGDEFKTEDKVKWLDIFISFNKHATPQAAYDHAAAIRRQAAAAGADFVALSKKYDNGLASGTNGLGIGSTRGKIQPADVEPALWALQPGQVSGLVETPAGYHIVKVLEREYAGPKAFDAKVQADIRKKLTDQYRAIEYQKMVEDLWRRGAVRVIDNPAAER